MATLDIANPFLATSTALVGIGGRSDSLRVRSFYGLHNQTVSYDGFNVIPDGGTTITGYISVYGYNK